MNEVILLHVGSNTLLLERGTEIDRLTDKIHETVKVLMDGCESDPTSAAAPLCIRHSDNSGN